MTALTPHSDTLSKLVYAYCKLQNFVPALASERVCARRH